jgi:hypothetical protein
MDPASGLWFHAFEEDSMNPLGRLAHRVSFRSGVMVFAAMVVLALSSTSARRVGRAVIAASVFPGEQYEAPRSWTERAYPNLIYYNKLDKGGHFSAWEQPQLFAAEVREAFKSLR